MSKKTNKFSASDFGHEAEVPQENAFYFGQQNFKWMLIGLAFIVVGFLLMMGPDANTVDGKFDPNSWNENSTSVCCYRICNRSVRDLKKKIKKFLYFEIKRLRN